MDRGFNINCLTREGIRLGWIMWKNDVCWDIIKIKGFDWWLGNDKWVLIWDTCCLVAFDVMGWVVVLWWWFGRRRRDEDK